MKLKIPNWGSLHKTNLSINPDFQVNQRGQTIYNPPQLTTGFYYTVDMWCVYLNNNDFDILEVVENGIKMKNSTQITQRRKGYLKAGTYTLVSKINGVVKEYTFTTNGIDTSVDKDVFSFVQGSGIWRFGLINLKYNDHIEYIDLWEGNIAYPHVKEAYTIALMRCLPKVERLKFGVTSSGSYFLPGASYKFPKSEVPSITFLYVADENGKIDEKPFSVSVIDKYLFNFIRYNGGSCAQFNGQTLTFDILISCESS